MENAGTHYHDVSSSLAASARDLRAHIPDVYHGYAELSSSAMAPGDVDAVHKELIALGIAITRMCDGCIASHTKSAARKGATKQQIAETIGVAIMMNGGPGTVYGPRAWDAFNEFYSDFHKEQAEG